MNKKIIVGASVFSFLLVATSVGIADWGPWSDTWEIETSDGSIALQSINNQANNTEITITSTQLNWTKVNDAYSYHLQISNNSAFTDVFYEKTDINSENYGSTYYQEVGNTVIFNVTRSINWDNNHYYRVRYSYEE